MTNQPTKPTTAPQRDYVSMVFLSAGLQMIQDVREMIVNGDLQLKDFAPELVITDGIEEELKTPPRDSAPAAPSPPALSELDRLELMTRGELLKKCEQLLEENNQLRHKMEQLTQPSQAHEKSAA